jgi:hypothetical protein
MSAKPLRVDTEALRVMSTRWTSLAGRLEMRTPDVPVASCFSAAAVTAGDAEISAASAVLSARVRTGAAKVAEAARRYNTNEANSASKLAALGGHHG